MTPTLVGARQSPAPFLYWEYPGRPQPAAFPLAAQAEGRDPGASFRQAIRVGRWKGVRYDVCEPLELYDLGRDAGETTNLVSNRPEVVARLTRIMDAARADTPAYTVPDPAECE
jgi:hypothetical protein